MLRRSIRWWFACTGGRALESSPTGQPLTPTTWRCPRTATLYFCRIRGEVSEKARLSRAPMSKILDMAIGATFLRAPRKPFALHRSIRNGLAYAAGGKRGALPLVRVIPTDRFG